MEKQKRGMYEISYEMYSLYNAQRLFTFTLEGSEVRFPLMAYESSTWFSSHVPSIF